MHSWVIADVAVWGVDSGGTLHCREMPGKDPIEVATLIFTTPTDMLVMRSR